MFLEQRSRDWHSADAKKGKDNLAAKRKELLGVFGKERRAQQFQQWYPVLRMLRNISLASQHQEPTVLHLQFRLSRARMAIEGMTDGNENKRRLAKVAKALEAVEEKIKKDDHAVALSLILDVQKMQVLSGADLKAYGNEEYAYLAAFVGRFEASSVQKDWQDIKILAVQFKDLGWNAWTGVFATLKEQGSQRAIDVLALRSTATDRRPLNASEVAFAQAAPLRNSFGQPDLATRQLRSRVA
ncbi:hypothetical protein DIPPA_33990 [Diplonema papillatum]|nr:hypothetical protein DIPPA_33990 [Diplonema papillatum]